MPGDPEMPSNTIILVHGIRTQAVWIEMVADVLHKQLGANVQPIRYGYFDAFRFLMPFFTRQSPIQRIIRECRDIKLSNPNTKLSVIAHSFGTYAISKSLLEPDIAFDKVIFCGSIVPENFRVSLHRDQLGRTPILNDCGTHDVWPVIAKSVTWGYGATGTFGFGTQGIRDRFSKFSHSSYFDRSFVANYWVPFLRDGTIKPTKWESERNSPPYWQSLLSWFPLKSFAFAGTIFIVAWLGGFLEKQKPPFITVGNQIFLGHWIGVKHVFARITFINTSSSDVKFLITDFKLRSPDNSATNLTAEGITNCEGMTPAEMQISVVGKSTRTCDYSFLGPTYELFDLYQKITQFYEINGLQAATPFPVKNIITGSLLSEIVETADERFSWSPGNWAAEIKYTANTNNEDILYQFSLDSDKVEVLKKQISYYKTGLGLLPNWRYLSPDGKQPMQPVLINKQQKTD